ncbi:MAG: hypothetical protein SAJ12_07305 [Jaaginema sp. PMC 1079.18]|nr:hypothetical protein [Jaaginema sp. PMC 1080.18]MEC4850804.1 hypothetical protein [Jaaginema sp. PMC 1079.18]MEC4868175.1 hypothetical protein [Jaaginema sp. PMC 1078.18]
MNNRPVFIGTSNAIVALDKIHSIHPVINWHEIPNKAKFGILVNTGSAETSFFLYDDEAHQFIRKLGLINWIPGTSTWADAEAQGGNNA